MASFYDALSGELARQAAQRYGSCREDTRVQGDSPYVHPPVIHFTTEFSILLGATESLQIDGLKNKEHRFPFIDSQAKDVLDKCTGLRDLSLVYVHLNSFEGLPRLPLLRSLQMQGNQIDSFKGLLHQPSLVELNLWGNVIKGFKYFPSLPKLEILNISCNRITGQLARLVARAPKLKIIKINLNPITDEEELKPLVQLEDLKELELYGCPVASDIQERGKESLFLKRLKEKGVRVLLQQSRMPVDMLKQLQQIEEEFKQKNQKNNYFYKCNTSPIPIIEITSVEQQKLNKN